MYNRHVKFRTKIPNRFGKMSEKKSGGIFLTHTVVRGQPNLRFHGWNNFREVGSHP